MKNKKITFLLIFILATIISYSQHDNGLLTEKDVPLLMRDGPFEFELFTLADQLAYYHPEKYDHFRSIYPSWSMTDDETAYHEFISDPNWTRNEFQTTGSFIYIITEAETDRFLGNLYIYPKANTDHDAEIYLWLGSDVNNTYEPLLEGMIKTWLAIEWPFQKPVFYGWDDTAQTK